MRLNNESPINLRRVPCFKCDFGVTEVILLKSENCFKQSVGTLYGG